MVEVPCKWARVNVTPIASAATMCPLAEEALVIFRDLQRSCSLMSDWSDGAGIGGLDWMVRSRSRIEAGLPVQNQPKELGLVQRVMECIVIAVEFGMDFFRDAA